jgi:C4-dicarboxylate transporter DctM subunit
MELYLFIGILILLILIKVPLAISLCMSSVFYMLISGQTFLIPVMAGRIFTGMTSFTLLALPMFILCGDLLYSGKASEALVKFANSLMGWITGGLSIVTTLACMFFGAVSGSGAATASSIGAVIAPEAEKEGYSKDYIAAVITAAGPLGILIPPSIPMVIFGAATGTSIGALLIAGIGPGVFFGTLLIVYGYFKLKKQGFKGNKFRLRNVFISFKESIWPLLTPIIILGGIYSGIFTPTEAASIAVFWSLIVGLFIYKTIKLKDLSAILYKSSITTAKIMLVIASVGFFSWVLSAERVPQSLTLFVLKYVDSQFVFLLLSAGIILLTGMFLNPTCAILLLAPIFMPMIHALKIDPVFFGALMVANLAIGLATPPVAMTLYVTASVIDAPLEKIIRSLIPQILLLVCGLILLIIFPQICMFLPRLFSAV